MNRRQRLLGLLGALAAAAALLPVAAQAAPHPPFQRRPVSHPIRQAPVPAQAAPNVVRPHAAASGNPASHIPCDLRNAYYGASTPLIGAGTTIAIVDYSDAPTIATDLAAFDSDTGLVDPPSFRVVRLGSPPQDSGWNHEITLDVEWAHAMAPGANLVLVETDDTGISLPTSGTDMLAGILAAVGSSVNADVVSMSWGFGVDASEIAFMNQLDARLPATNAAGGPVAYVASAGDWGFGLEWPAVSPKVIGVGGTSLDPAAFGYTGTAGHNTVNHALATAGFWTCSPQVTPGVNGTNEHVWGNSPTETWTSPGAGTGGGTLADYPNSGSTRSVPDVAMDSDPADGGVSIVEGGAWDSGWGGTSLAAPMWAGVIASLDQGRVANGHPALGGNSWIHTASASDFNDVLVGSAPTTPTDPCLTSLSDSCQAKAGNDLVTGRGSPKISTLVGDQLATPAGGPFVPLSSPRRAIDTRAAPTGWPTACTSALGGGGICSLTVPGYPGGTPYVPASAIAVVLNVTVISNTVATYVTAFPAGTPLPNSSSVNVQPDGQAVANLVEVKIGQGGQVDFFNSQGTASLVVDVEGYVNGTPTGSGLFTPVGPTRLADTRPATQVGPKNTPLGAHQAMDVQVPGSPAAAILNLTVTDGTAAGYLQVYPKGAGTPGAASNLNFAAGQTVAGRAMVGTGTGANAGAITVFNGGSAAVNVIVDEYGNFTSSGKNFYPMAPDRVLDTRNPGRSALFAGGVSALHLPNPIPGAVALVGNFTVTDGTATSYITVGAQGLPAIPGTSDINFVSGQVKANLCVPAPDPSQSGTLGIFNSVGSVSVIGDIAGWYA